jgi:capsular exopolysaccharide synthesis family protein
MSKLFEALNNSERGNADFLLPLLKAEGSAAAAVGSKPDSGAGRPQVEEAGNRTAGSVVENALAPAQIRTLTLHPASCSPVLPFDGGQSQAADQYRILRTKITQHPRQPRFILISSPASGDGRSVSAVNIAGVLSLNSDAKVLLVDADFRRSTIHTHLGLPAAPGLAEVLAGVCGVQQAVINAEELPNLYVLPAGNSPSSPAELLAGAQWPALCSRLRTLFRHVIVDSPPVDSIADYALIQEACDGVILVIRPDHTKRRRYREALRAIPKAKFLGVLLNRVPAWSLKRYAPADYYSGGPYARSAGNLKPVLLEDARPASTVDTGLVQLL